MRINWCDIHNAPPEVDGVFCMGEGNGPCRWVPMRLIPDNALLLTECSDLELAAERDRRSPKPTKGGIVVAYPQALDGETP